ncbi:MAG: hypothetical protein WAT74_00215 [Flavobacteriales bacterium]
MTSNIHYFSRRWEETRGDEHSDWGCSMWLFEVDASLNVLRQIEVYDSGVCLKYSQTHVEDEFGGLAEKPLDDEDWAPYETSKEVFEQVWATTKAANG